MSLTTKTLQQQRKDPPCPGTFAKVEQRMTFDWPGFFREMKAKTGIGMLHIADNSWKVADELAARWPTCAVGNQCAVIPRTFLGEPYDDRLAQLGSDFSAYISEHNIDKAERCFKAIERRAAVVIAKELDKAKRAERKAKKFKPLITAYPARARRVTKRKK